MCGSSRFLLIGRKECVNERRISFDAPLSANLKRAHFVRAALQEIAFSIKWNFDILTEVTRLNVTMFGCAEEDSKAKHSLNISRTFFRKKSMFKRDIIRHLSWGCSHLQRNPSIDGRDVSKCPGDRTAGLSGRTGFI